MEVYESKCKLSAESNIARPKRNRAWLQANSQNNCMEPEFFSPGNIAGKLNYIRAIKMQNEKLREISWIHSHLVRGPLARIMGLVQIIENLKDEGDIGTILEYISISATELDSAIKQISDKSMPVSV